VLVLEYDGAEFAGWARQPGLRTVQEEVERALAVLLRLPAGHPRARLTVAGRTDRGVHALAQVASYAGPPVRVDGLNALLPEDVAVRECSEAPADFDARGHATSRAYCYRVLARRPRGALHRGRALWWPYRVDAAALSECAAALVGTHDFTAFTPTETDHVRFTRDVYTAAWMRGGENGELLEFWIEADSFMRNMNRVLVGTMLQVAGGRRPVGEFVSLLEGRPRSAAGPTAPAHGLYLAGVGYGGKRVLDPRGLDAPGLDPPGLDPPGLDPPGLDPPGLDPRRERSWRTGPPRGVGSAG
jgi:tRNA pseudouridine38-40 synthase